MTTQPQSGAAMEPTQEDQHLVALIRTYLINPSAFLFNDEQCSVLVRQHVASEAAELRKDLEIFTSDRNGLMAINEKHRATIAAQAAQIDTLRGSLEAYATPEPGRHPMEGLLQEKPSPQPL